MEEGPHTGQPRPEMTGSDPQPAEVPFPASSLPARNIPEQVPSQEEDVAEDAERSNAVATAVMNRWPRQETLALLKIRSDMDAAFRDASLKAPLWEEVSRKMAEMGYVRSAKKCKEKFENVHKYYKRTKDGRAAAGKNYRFFSQLEALTAGGGSSSTAANQNLASFSAPLPASAVGRIQTAPIPAPPISSAGPGHPVHVAGFSSSVYSSSSSDSDDNYEDTEEGYVAGEGRKRKRSGRVLGRKMMAFFDGMMKQVMERQEAMQLKFLETIEEREQERMKREEAWKRQEMAKLNREYELIAKERAAAASREAAVMAVLQKFNSPLTDTVVLDASAPKSGPPTTPPEPPPPSQLQQPQQQHQQPLSSSTELVPIPEPDELAVVVGGFQLAIPSNRWPKAEVHDLIRLRTALEPRYQEPGPKVALWEEISVEMRRLGHNRSAKRCKEKWENINKYFKKVKESNKKRPEDAKTCPYFHQLDALYRRKAAIQQEPETQAPLQLEQEIKNGNDSGDGQNPETGALTGNGGLPPSFFGEGSSSAVAVKQELMEQQQQQQEKEEAAAADGYGKLPEPDSDDMGQDDDNDDGDDDDGDGDESVGKMQYKLHFPTGGSSSGSGSNSGSGSSKNATATTVPAGSFLAVL